MIPEAYLKTVFDIWSERGEKSTCSITGNCMSPMIRDGDSLVIEHGNQDVHVGDVVVYGTSGKFYTHRIIRIEYKDGRESFLLKGDRSSAFDQPISRDRILGKVIEVRGPNRYICFNSVFWKCLNYILSIRSYISVRRLNADSLFWKGVKFFFSLRSKILPWRCSPDLILWNGISRIYRMRLSIQKYVLSQKWR